ncbi:MAG: MauE/DoxX family redox-associated membrane protein [Pseudomonadota bacterium]
MMDPVLHIAIRLLLALIVAAALVHKLSDWRRFVGVVRSYAVTPVGAAVYAGAAVIAFELGVLGSLLFGGQILAAAASTVLFSGYGLLIAFSIRRGNARIDCGCSWAKGAELTAGYYVRNFALACLCLVLAAPLAERALTWFDYSNAAFFAVNLAGLYFTADGLLHLRSLTRRA